MLQHQPKSGDIVLEIVHWRTKEEKKRIPTIWGWQATTT